MKTKLFQDDIEDIIVLLYHVIGRIDVEYIEEKICAFSFSLFVTIKIRSTELNG